MNITNTLKGQGPSVRSVLLADEDADDHEFFRTALREIDPTIRLDIVKNGKQLLQLLTYYVPDLLFLDLDMPVKNGLESLLSIRSSPQWKDLPVVAFSSTSRPSNVETAYAMGADLYFMKSPTFTDLISLLRALLAMDWSDPARVKEQYRVNDRYTAFM